MEMKPNRKPLGCNPLSDAPYRNPGMALNGKEPGCHPVGGAPCRDLDAVSSEQGSGRRFLSGALHRRPSVVTNVGLSESEKRKFWEDLDDMVRTVPTNENLFIDLNGHVGSKNVGYELAHGGFGYGSRNQEEDILDFAVAYNLVIANTFFRNRDSHLVTFSSGHRSSQIDFVLTRRKDNQACLDCKVILRESVVPQHNLVVANFRFRISTHRVKQVKIARTKWWELKGERSKVFRERVFVEGAWSEEEDANIMWVKMATCIRKVASEVFRVTKVSGGESKDTWWWTEDVQKAIKEKKECYRSLFHDRSAFNIERYKVAKKTTKRAVSEAKGRAYDDLYQRLSTKKGEKDVYKIARIQERETRDLNQVKCIKDEMDQLLVKGQDIKQRWQRYFDNLFNGENETMDTQLDDSFDDLNKCFVRRIQESEVKEALKRMKGGKAMGLDGIPIEVWKCLGDSAIVWLTKLFNHIFRSNRMPGEWRSTLVSIFKNKGYIQSCTNYRDIKLMSHTMKLWERVIEHRLRGMTHITMNQFRFMPARSTMEAIFLIR
ncbi:hypothetical protein ZEAMMB73_Zm00001d049314 [Zea mays]|uniref:Retrovirus-related Pol polyprotein LINE-1 n=1 Tax=Zea mays TaxID=4577 RepID=A0A1D6PTS5_MAIZE|nr:hypothetical protein ZEAMMB73_Zm00001d049314 [Zea mays]